MRIHEVKDQYAIVLSKITHLNKVEKSTYYGVYGPSAPEYGFWVHFGYKESAFIKFDAEVDAIAERQRIIANINAFV